MADIGNWWLLDQKSARQFPADLTAVFVLVALTAGAVFVPGVSETPLRIVLGLPFLLFLPGYALVAALFPEKGIVDREKHAAASEQITGGTGSIEVIVRLGLSFGASTAVVMLLSYGLNFTPLGIRLAPVVFAVAGFTVGCTLLAAYRRRALPERARFAVPYRRWYAVARSEILRPKSGVDLALNVLLVATLLLAAASVAYAVAPPAEEGGVTEFYLLTADENGEFTAEGYPSDASTGGSVVAGVTNREHETIEYTMVVQLQHVPPEPGDSAANVTVERREELQRSQTELGHNESWRETVQIEPETGGDDLRVAFLLYRGEPPAEPTIDDAYRHVHLWLNGSESGTEPSVTRRR